jgi:hypothetical protein
MKLSKHNSFYSKSSEEERSEWFFVEFIDWRYAAFSILILIILALFQRVFEGLIFSFIFKNIKS